MENIHNLHNPLYKIEEKDGFWEVNFNSPRPLYESVMAIIKKQKQEEEKYKDLDEEREFIDRIVGSVWEGILKRAREKKIAIVRNDLMKFELKNDGYFFTLNIYYLQGPNLEHIKNYPNKFNFKFIQDLKVDKNLKIRNTLLVGQDLKPFETAETNKVDKIGRVLEIKLTFSSKTKKELENVQTIDTFVVGLGVINNDEFKKLKGKKVGDKIEFSARKILYGWDQSDNFLNHDVIVTVEITKIKNVLWRSSIEQLWDEKEIKDQYKTIENLERFIEDLSKFELKIFDNFHWSYNFVEWLVKSPVFSLSDVAKKQMEIKYEEVFKKAKESEEIRNKLKPELKEIKDLDQFIKKATEVEVNPFKISALVDDAITVDEEHKKLSDFIQHNLVIYFKYHREIFAKQDLAITTLMNYLTIIKVAKVQNINQTYEFIKEEINNFKLKDIY
ncbi:hypothetical protein ACA758_05035 [Mycoplasmopsis agassizii]|uniref:hypothetical protein n=1 Tax=Mycoplasmopsis agassizii TaxID=33922 RepID=UPI00352726D0